MFTGSLGIVDEEWFFKIHVMIEYYAGSVVFSLKKILDIIDEKHETRQEKAKCLKIVLENLSTMNLGLQKLNNVLEQLPLSCDPYIFFSALRLFLGSYKDGKGRTEGIFLSSPNFLISFFHAIGTQNHLIATSRVDL